MSICKEIKVEEQMKSMNEEIYTKIVKSIIAWLQIGVTNVLITSYLFIHVVES